MGPNALFPLGCVPEPSFVAIGYEAWFCALPSKKIAIELLIRNSHT